MGAWLILRAAMLPALLLVIALLVSAGTPGTFVGAIADLSPPEDGKSWIYVQGRNGWVRKVEVSSAQVVYHRSVPGRRRARLPASSLIVGAEVRVTAEQDEEGGWHAQRVEILRLPGKVKETTAER